MAEMGKVMKCAVTFTKDFHALAKARDSSALLQVLRGMDGCIGKLAELSEKCDGPAVMAASMMPFGVGNAVSTVCSTSSSIVEKYRGFSGALAAAGFNSASCPVGSSPASSSSGGGESKASKSKSSGSKGSKGDGHHADDGSTSAKSHSGGGKSKISKSKSSGGKGSKGDGHHADDGSTSTQSHSGGGKSKPSKSKSSGSKGSKGDGHHADDGSTSTQSHSGGGKSKPSKSKSSGSKGSKGQAASSNRKSSHHLSPPPPPVIFRQDRGGMIESYSPPWNVYLLWTSSMQNLREYSETSMTSRSRLLLLLLLLFPLKRTHHMSRSEFVRRALRLGSRAETGSIDPHESHFLTGGFDSPKFTNDLANTCCSVIVAPPFANGFDVYSPADKTEARIQQVSLLAVLSRCI
jgi:hypothetical protein